MKTHFHAGAGVTGLSFQRYPVANGNECFAFSNVLNVKRTLLLIAVVVVVVAALFTRSPAISAHLLR